MRNTACMPTVSDEELKDWPPHALLAPLTSEQQAVHDTVAAIWLQHRRWPVRGFLEHEMDRRGLDLASILPTFPTLPSVNTGGPIYSAIRYDRHSYAQNDPVRLTIAGMCHLQEAHQAAAKVFLQLLRRMAEHFLREPVDPFATPDREVAIATLASGIRGSQDWLAEMPGVMAFEPPTWGGQTASQGNSTRWRYQRDMRHFGEVDTLPEYVAILAGYMEPVQAQLRSVPPEPLDLAASLDFLDTVWRLKYGKPLFVLPSALSVVSCTGDAWTAEEFDARLSDLVQILKSISLAGVGHPIARLRAQLLMDLPPAAEQRVVAATETLTAVSTVRNGAQHRSAEPETIQALARFGLEYPLSDWQGGWLAIRAWTAHAFAELRDEVLASARDGAAPEEAAS
jgi:hypothetical protein